jgi:hypothetical protein
MKTTLPIKLFLAITITFFCSPTFAQGPADPGNDPMISSNNSIIHENIKIPLQTSENKKVVVHTSQNNSAKEEVATSSFKNHQEKIASVSFFKTEENEKALQSILELASISLLSQI